MQKGGQGLVHFSVESCLQIQFRLLHQFEYIFLGLVINMKSAKFLFILLCTYKLEWSAYIACLRPLPMLFSLSSNATVFVQEKCLIAGQMQILKLRIVYEF